MTDFQLAVPPHSTFTFTIQTIHYCCTTPKTTLYSTHIYCFLLFLLIFVVFPFDDEEVQVGGLRLYILHFVVVFPYFTLPVVSCSFLFSCSLELPSRYLHHRARQWVLFVLIYLFFTVTNRTDCLLDTRGGGLLDGKAGFIYFSFFVFFSF